VEVTNESNIGKVKSYYLLLIRLMQSAIKTQNNQLINNKLIQIKVTDSDNDNQLLKE